MKAFLRDNLMIVVSIGLPVLVVISFALATLVPRWLSEPPGYGFLMAIEAPAVSGLSSPVRLELDVAGGRLRARVFPLDNGARAYLPRLLEYVAADDSVREIPVSLPDDAANLPAGAEVEIPQISGRRLEPGLRAPDGYAFEQGGSGGGGLFTELFGGRYRIEPRLRKNGVVVRVRVPSAPPYYYGVRFLGWVVE